MVGPRRIGVHARTLAHRIEAAQHEWVVHSTYGQEMFTVVLVAQTELAEQHEQVHLADAEFDVATGRRGRPLEEPVGATSPDR